MKATEKKSDQIIKMKRCVIAEAIFVVFTLLLALCLPAAVERARDAASLANLRTACTDAAEFYYEKSTSGTAEEMNIIDIPNVVIKSNRANNWSEITGDLMFELPQDPGSSGSFTARFFIPNGFDFNTQKVSCELFNS